MSADVFLRRSEMRRRLKGLPNNRRSAFCSCCAFCCNIRSRRSSSLADCAARTDSIIRHAPCSQVAACILSLSSLCFRSSLRAIRHRHAAASSTDACLSQSSRRKFPANPPEAFLLRTLKEDGGTGGSRIARLPSSEKQMSVHQHGHMRMCACVRVCVCVCVCV